MWSVVIVHVLINLKAFEVELPLRGKIKEKKALKEGIGI